MLRAFINPRLRAELELDRPALSVWEALFRVGVEFLVAATIIAAVAGTFFGKVHAPMPVWAWTIVGPYIFFMLYCSNYIVARFVKSRLVKVAWWCVVPFLALAIVSLALNVTGANQSVEATQPRPEVSHDL